MHRLISKLFYLITIVAFIHVHTTHCAAAAVPEVKQGWLGSKLNSVQTLRLDEGTIAGVDRAIAGLGRANESLGSTMKAFGPKLEAAAGKLPETAAIVMATVSDTMRDLVPISELAKDGIVQVADHFRGAARETSATVAHSVVAAATALAPTAEHIRHGMHDVSLQLTTAVQRGAAIGGDKAIEAADRLRQGMTHATDALRDGIVHSTDRALQTAVVAQEIQRATPMTFYKMVKSATVVILGGGIASKGADLFIDGVKKYRNSNSDPEKRERIRIEGLNLMKAGAGVTLTGLIIIYLGKPKLGQTPTPPAAPAPLAQPSRVIAL